MGSIANKLQAVGCAVLGLLVVVGVLVVGLALLAIGDGGESAAGSGGGSGGRLSSIACEVGDSCDLGGPTVTVTKAEVTGLVTTKHGDYEGNYVVVEFEYTHGGSQPATVKPYSWKLEDGQGRSYDYAPEESLDYASTENRELEAMDMNPGTKRLGAMVFEVALDAEDFTLIVNDLIFPRTSKKAEVELKGPLSVRVGALNASAIPHALAPDLVGRLAASLGGRSLFRSGPLAPECPFVSRLCDPRLVGKNARPRESENTKIFRLTFRAVLGDGSPQIRLEPSTAIGRDAFSEARFEGFLGGAPHR